MAPRREFSFDIFIGTPISRLDRFARQIDLPVKEFIVFTRFALASNKLAHQIPHDL